jgi:hypothetical protein
MVALNMNVVRSRGITFRIFSTCKVQASEHNIAEATSFSKSIDKMRSASSITYVRVIMSKASDSNEQGT